MRQITKESVRAFYKQERFYKNNTSVIDTFFGAKFYLHNNLIAEIKNGKLYISNCGWFSNTTKERLNGILDYIGKPRIYQKRFEWFLDGEKWNGNRVEIKL
jgi:hypothetical protein